MKVIHISYCFYPDTVGGTEVYVKSLCKRLSKFGVESIVAAPIEGRSKVYFDEGIKVRRFGISKKLEDLSDLYGGSDPIALNEFSDMLNEEKPDILHMHALTYAASLGIAREARSRNIPVVFTYHTPTVSCQSGLLIIWKKKICKGFLDARICSTCTLYRFNIPRGIADILALIPASLGALMKKYRFSGKFFTAIRMRCLIEHRIKLLKNFMEEADRIIVLCSWARELLLRNKVPLKKISLIRHGVFRPDTDNADGLMENIPYNSRPLKIVYLGRIDWTKGLDTVIKALKYIPEETIELDVYGVVQAQSANKYFEKLKKYAGQSNVRINFLSPVPSCDVVPLLRKYHYLVVPSVWMETGPLVVLEALAAGTPVIGSDLGGIKELVKNYKNGILIPMGSTREWVDVLKKISQDRELLNKLRRGIKPPRTMQDVAKDIMPIYNSLISRKRYDQENAI